MYVYIYSEGHSAWFELTVSCSHRCHTGAMTATWVKEVRKHLLSLGFRGRNI